jgi:hypothetical protein
MVNEAAIQLALDDLKSQEVINFTATAKMYNLDRTTLMRRFKGKTTSYQASRSVHQKLLTDAQEEVLLHYISDLSDRGMPPTPQILENLIVEIVRKPIGQCWVRRFCQRHRNKIKSIYLRGIDQSRKVADNSAYFEHFYRVVRVLPSLVPLKSYTLRWVLTSPV